MMGQSTVNIARAFSQQIIRTATTGLLQDVPSTRTERNTREYALLCSGPGGDKIHNATIPVQQLNPQWNQRNGPPARKLRTLRVITLSPC